MPKTISAKCISLQSCRVLGMRVDGTSYQDATQRVLAWAHNGESRYVCVATVHMVMEAHDAPEFLRMVNGADLVTPDGMPLVWALRLYRSAEATRVYGPDLTIHLLRAAAKERIPVGFYGGTPQVLQQLQQAAAERFPGLDIAYLHAPPFRPLTPEESDRTVRDIENSGVRILFVGLGCPKQERWMSEHCRRVKAVMLGVGAAFDFIAGNKPQAPHWMQDRGLEWLFRLFAEPRRLWRRYLFKNPRFMALFLLQMLKLRRFEP